MTRASMAVEGLEPFRRGVADVAAGLPEELDAIYDDAADLIVAAVRPLLPRRSGRLASSLRAVSGGVTLGQGVPYAGWVEFGGAIGRNESIKRRYVRSGRHLYPATARRWSDIQAAAVDGLDRLTDRAGLR